MIMAKRTFFSLLYALICIVSFGHPAAADTRAARLPTPCGMEGA